MSRAEAVRVGPAVALAALAMRTKRVRLGTAVTVLPFPDQLGLASPAALNAGGINQGFRFAVTTPWTNMAWRVEAATNLDASAADWLPVYTNPTGAGGGLLFTDLLATNFPQRYYRAVFP